MPDDSQLCRYKPVLDESAPDLILARRKNQVDTTTTLETPHAIYGMNDDMNIPDGLAFQFSHSNQTTNIGFLRIFTVSTDILLDFLKVKVLQWLIK